MTNEELDELCRVGSDEADEWIAAITFLRARLAEAETAILYVKRIAPATCECPACQYARAYLRTSDGADAVPSRSVQRRVAIMKGEPVPEFGKDDMGSCPNCGHRAQP